MPSTTTVRFLKPDIFFDPRYSAATWSAEDVSFLTRGITSSANSVIFFTAFQCGISPTCKCRMTLLLWACSHQNAMRAAPWSGVPSTVRQTDVKPSQVTSVSGMPPEAKRSFYVETGGYPGGE